jgi:hypothetical protein
VPTRLLILTHSWIIPIVPATIFPKVMFLN